jgi:hypothetical protein
MKGFHFTILIACLGLMGCGRAEPSGQDFAACRFELIKHYKLPASGVRIPDDDPKLEFWQACMKARGYHFDPYLQGCTAPQMGRVYSPACYEQMAR